METIAWVLTSAALLAAALAGLQIYRTEKMTQSGRLDRLERLAERTGVSSADLPHEAIRLTYALDTDTILDLYHQALAARGSPIWKTFEDETESDLPPGLPIWPFTSPPGRKNDPVQRPSEDEPARAAVAVEKQLREAHSIHSIDLTSAVDERPGNLLLSNLEHRASEAGVQIPEETKQVLNRVWESRDQETTRESLANLAGFVKIRADFTVNSSDSGDLLLEARSKKASQSSKLSILCKQEHILNSARALFVPGESVRANCFGIVTRWDENRDTLSLLPLAIHS